MAAEGVTTRAPAPSVHTSVILRRANRTNRLPGNKRVSSRNRMQINHIPSLKIIRRSLNSLRRHLNNLSLNVTRPRTHNQCSCVSTPEDIFVTLLFLKRRYVKGIGRLQQRCNSTAPVRLSSLVDNVTRNHEQYRSRQTSIATVLVLPHTRRISNKFRRTSNNARHAQSRVRLILGSRV